MCQREFPEDLVTSYWIVDPEQHQLRIPTSLIQMMACRSRTSHPCRRPPRNIPSLCLTAASSAPVHGVGRQKEIPTNGAAKPSWFSGRTLVVAHVTEPVVRCRLILVTADLVTRRDFALIYEYVVCHVWGTERLSHSNLMNCAEVRLLLLDSPLSGIREKGCQPSSRHLFRRTSQPRNSVLH